MLGGKSVIRELAEWSAARGAEIGYENVFDYSLGNPSVPCPPQFTAAMLRLLQTQEPVALHGYSPTLTIPSVRAAVAENLNARFGMDYTAGHIFMTAGAAGAIAHALRCVAVPGQEVLTFAPYFPEYKPYAEGAGLTPARCAACVQDFQIDFDAFEAMLSPNTAAVLINTPNNPSGIAYSSETLRRLADALRAASARFGHHIFLISDEPYREIVFGGACQQHPAAYYDDTLTCYSFSKSLSLPGERIGYVAANPRCEQAASSCRCAARSAAAPATTARPASSSSPWPNVLIRPATSVSMSATWSFCTPSSSASASRSSSPAARSISSPKRWKTTRSLSAAKRRPTTSPLCPAIRSAALAISAWPTASTPKKSGAASPRSSALCAREYGAR